ncbi:MAG: hypothetical protein ACYCT9_05025 [Leptospirillum sp.]|jgi:hypothetical protein
MAFKLRDPQMDVQQYADGYVKLHENYPVDLSLEEKFKAISKSIRYLDQSLLHDVARWKSPRSAGHINENSEEYIQEITSFAFNAKEERSRIEILTVLDGVGWPMASVILHFFHPDQYPILDFRALWSLSTEPPQQYDFPFWWSYVQACRDLSKKFGVDMRTLDRALWKYSKDHQGDGK